MSSNRHPALKLDARSASVEWIYAIGDIHGRLDLLDDALAAIEAHRDGKRALIVTLGDYVDRGPDSAGVVSRLRELERSGAVLCLLGNHEALMSKALRCGERDRWYRNGGEATMASYAGDVPADDIDWMEALPLMWTDGHRIYVHGGLAPFVPMEEQDEHTCTWIRTPFLKAPAEAFPAHIVHGHTTRWEGKLDRGEPELLPHRTNLDTAAFKTGVLTIGVFDAAKPGGPVDLLRITGAETDLED
jgi:serine/threonine protein phosphatase 1